MAISRVTVPSEFFDITSGMMLKTPTPQFAFAQMAIAAQNRAALAAVDARCWHRVRALLRVRGRVRR